MMCSFVKQGETSERAPPRIMMRTSPRWSQGRLKFKGVDDDEDITTLDTSTPSSFSNCNSSLTQKGDNDAVVLDLG
ncbi:hypothetical protein BDA96_10G154500 [Sorghum bicolor]|uniref:Uncharacterized protein n=1 Tax=Sorghum bicolor TaxID=4558 RepID=A0A921U0D3_SORBI|nr:hypothetical protein BDA96_10G154500 [Sorghum bicolor]